MEISHPGQALFKSLTLTICKIMLILCHPQHGPGGGFLRSRVTGTNTYFSEKPLKDGAERHAQGSARHPEQLVPVIVTAVISVFMDKHRQGGTEIAISLYR